MAGDDAQMPPNPFTLMQENAVQMHEQYMSYIEAGFTEAQAFEFVRTMLAEIFRHVLRGGE